MSRLAEVVRCLGGGGSMASFGDRSSSSRPAFCQEGKGPRGETLERLLRESPVMPGRFRRACWRARNLLTSLQVRVGLAKFEEGSASPLAASSKRKRVVVVGGGWSAAAFTRLLDPRQFEVVLISPNPHFSFTPLLPSACAGSIPVSSCVLPLWRLLSLGGSCTARGRFECAFAEEVDAERRIVKCVSADSSQARWEEPYDYALLAVGSEVNTFNVPGAETNSLFLKTAQDARKIRARVASCMREAALPGTSETEKRRLLTFVVVGAGPTGVECAAEIQDFLNKEGRSQFPQLESFFKVVVVEMTPAPLPMYDEKVQASTRESFRKTGVELLTRTQVVRVGDEGVTVAFKKEDGSSEQAVIPSGLVLWASGVKPTQLATSLAKKLDGQTTPNRLLVDPAFRVLGADGLFAIGDCCTEKPPSLAERAEELHALAVKENKPTGAGTEWLTTNSSRLSRVFPQLHPSKSKLSEMAPRNNLTLEAFTELLKELDKKYMPPLPTAQNAVQEGEFLAMVFNESLGPRASKTPKCLPAFVERWKGSLCFLGNGTAALQLPLGTFVGSFPHFYIWKLVYLQMQFEAFSVWRCAEGWLRKALFGRDVFAEV